MESITLRPVDMKRDCAQLAALFSLEQDEPASVAGLKVDYEEHRERIFRLMAAVDDQGELVGFNWATHSRFNREEAYFYVIVKPEWRGRGAGTRLYEDLEQAARAAGVKQLQGSVRDTCPQCRRFAKERGFKEKSHSVGLALDLDAFADQAYDELLAKLRRDGFQFTTMEALGNMEEAQRKLYRLNDTTLMEAIVPEDQHSWLSFEDFQKKVCRTAWYKPGGQIVAIDTASGTWTAMSAITRFEGSECAYNLHTGVDRRYHGRKLAQAVLVLALRYAREVLNVGCVWSDENAREAGVLAIYQELGYTTRPGSISLRKVLG